MSTRKIKFRKVSDRLYVNVDPIPGTTVEVYANGWGRRQPRYSIRMTNLATKEAVTYLYSSKGKYKGQPRAWSLGQAKFHANILRNSPKTLAKWGLIPATDTDISSAGQ